MVVVCLDDDRLVLVDAANVVVYHFVFKPRLRRHRHLGHQVVEIQILYRSNRVELRERKELGLSLQARFDSE